MHFYEKRALFFEKKKQHQTIHPTPYSILFLSVLYQNKALYNFRKRGEYSIVEHNKGLEYALHSQINLIKFVEPCRYIISYI